MFVFFSLLQFPQIWIFSMTARHSHKRIMILIQFLHKPGARSIRIRCVSPELRLNQRMPPNLQLIVPWNCIMTCHPSYSPEVNKTPMQGRCVTEFHSFHSPSKRESTPDSGRCLKSEQKQTCIIWETSPLPVKKPFANVCFSLESPKLKKRKNKEKTAKQTGGRWLSTLEGGHLVVQMYYSSNQTNSHGCLKRGGSPEKPWSYWILVQVEFLDHLPFGGIFSLNYDVGRKSNDLTHRIHKTGIFTY